jgi:hypothetical protein
VQSRKQKGRARDPASILHRANNLIKARRFIPNSSRNQMVHWHPDSSRQLANTLRGAEWMANEWLIQASRDPGGR